ncbi:MAG: hypothetical protein OJF60_002714 [Burkholderiaceae bacterium]|nr:MAG: hypothetical protein OJF60_002714 [Burkholderiaceae bacterium]
MTRGPACGDRHREFDRGGRPSGVQTCTDGIGGRRMGTEARRRV